MGRAKQLIIAEQEESSMVSTWTEYLVLERRAKTKDWRLFVGKYEALAEAAAYYDEDTDSYRIPKTINGKKVVGQDDEWLVGGPLQCWGDPDCTFSQVDAKLVAWLQEFGWTGEDVLPELDRALSKLGAAWTHLKSFELEGEYFHLWLDTGESRPFVVLRKAFHELKTNPVIFKVSATNSRRFLNAVRSAWYLMTKSDVDVEGVSSLGRKIQNVSKSLAKNVPAMFERMLDERLDNGRVTSLRNFEPDAFPRVLFASKHVTVAELREKTEFKPHLIVYSHYHGYEIDPAAHIEDLRFKGTAQCGMHGLDFWGVTFEELALDGFDLERSNEGY